MLTVGKVVASLLAAAYLGKDLELMHWKPVIYSSSIGTIIALVLLIFFVKENQS